MEILSMGLFAKLFRRKSAGDQSNIPNEYRMAIACNQEFEELMTADKYIARSDYRYLLDKYKDIYTFFDSAKKAKTLSYYCKQNHVQETEINKFLCFYEDIVDLKKGSSIFQEHNESYIADHLLSEKNYLDRILYEVDPNILLDDEQRKVVLSDEDYTLIIIVFYQLL